MPASFLVTISFDGVLSGTDVSAYVRALSTDRGMSRFDGAYPPRYTAGTATLVLDNRDGRFDPFNTNGPYLDVDGQSLIIPIRPLAQISLNDGSGAVPIFTGNVDSWTPTYPASGKDALCTVRCVDAIARLNARDRDAVVSQGDSESTGNRMTRILDALGGFPDRDIAPNTDLTQNVLAATTLVGNPWAEIQLVADSEPGEAFFAADGTFVFRDRATLASAFYAAPSHALTDLAPPAYGFQDISVASDPVQIRNAVYITSADAYQDNQVDLDSADIFGWREYRRDDLLFLDGGGGATEAYSTFLLSVLSDADPRIDEVSFMPAADPTHLWATAKTVELGDRISVRFNPPGAGDVIERQAFVRGIAHSCGPNLDGWTTRLALQDAQRLTVMVFDDAFAGRFDVGRFGY